MDVHCKNRDVDISQLCRLCAAHDENPVSIFEGPGLELELEIKLHKYLSLQVSENDILPHHICMKCSNTLISWHELVIGCKEAEERFLSLLSEKRITSNLDDDVIELEDSQDSVEIIRSDDKPVSKSHTDSSDLRSSLRANFGKLFRASGVVSGTTEEHQKSSPHRESTLSTNTAESELSASVHRPQPSLLGQPTTTDGTTQLLQSQNSNSTVSQPFFRLLAVGPSQPTTTDGTTQLLQSQNNNGTISQPLFGLLAVGPPQRTTTDGAIQLLKSHNSSSTVGQPVFGLVTVGPPPSTSTEGTFIVSQGLGSKNVVSSQPSAGQLIIALSQPTSVGGAALRSNCLAKGNAVITQTSTGQSPTAPAGNLVQVINKRTGQAPSQSLPSSVLHQSSPASLQKLKTIVPSRPESTPAIISLPDSSKKKSDFVALLIPQTSLNTGPLLSTDSGTKSPVVAVPVILSRKSTRDPPIISGGEDAVLVQSSNLEIDSRELPDDVLIEDATDLVDNGVGIDSDGLREPSPCPSHSLTNNSWENMQVEAAICRSAAQSAIFQEDVALESNKRKSAPWDHVPIHGDHGYSKSVKALKESSSKQKKRDVAVTKQRSSSTLLRKIDKKGCFVCGKAINNRTLLLSHEKSHFRSLKSPSHKCRFCTESFKTFDGMVSHRRKHQRGVFALRENHQGSEEIEKSEEVSEPNSCDDISVADDGVGTSEMAVDDENLPGISKVKSKENPKKASLGRKCTMCGLYFKKRDELNQHKLTAHTDAERTRPYPCTVCGKRFIKNNSLRVHLEIHSEGTELCPHCGKLFKQRSSLGAHIRRKHNESRKYPYQCELCPKRFEYQKQLLLHTNFHTGERPYVCDKCGKSFRTPGTLKQHLICHEDVRPRKCNVCGKGFKWTKNLIQHSMTHVSKHLRPINHVTKKYLYQNKMSPCKICGKTFYSTTNLKLHTYRIHRDVYYREYPGGEPLMCKLCPRMFSKQATLEIHMEQNHAVSQKGFRCDFCPKRFTLKTRRDTHMRVHTGERPFACEHCDKSFMCSSYLKAHLVSHSEVRRYSCQFCDKSFKKKAHLNVHVRSHTGERPYACEVCGRRFIQVCERNKHRGTHFGGKPYECVICGSLFKLKVELVEHMDKHHPESEHPEDVFEEEVEIDYSAILPVDNEDTNS